jgi:hypothetical protein
MSEMEKPSRCAECGALVEESGTFHPYMFCVLKKAGRDPWVDFSWCVKALGLGILPAKPPLVRDLPIEAQTFDRVAAVSVGGGGEEK